MTDQLSSLIAAVKSADSSSLLEAAVKDLAQAHLEEAIPELIAALGYNNPGAAVAAVEGLVELGEPSVPGLLEKFNQNNYTARAWIIRALAKIGDPRGLVILLEAAITDFALSVRRAAARGLGIIKWKRFPPEILDIGLEQALKVLLIAFKDDEWIVRYAAVVGLEEILNIISEEFPELRKKIWFQLKQMLLNDSSLAVRARIQMMQNNIQRNLGEKKPENISQSSLLSVEDWTIIRIKLDEFKTQNLLKFVEPQSQN